MVEENDMSDEHKLPFYCPITGKQHRNTNTRLMQAIHAIIETQHFKVPYIYSFTYKVVEFTKEENTSNVLHNISSVTNYTMEAILNNYY